MHFTRIAGKWGRQWKVGMESGNGNDQQKMGDKYHHANIQVGF